MIKCIDPKHYNLTEGKEYQTIDGVTEEDSYYTIENDKGNIARYSRTLFEEVIEEPEPEPEPTPTPFTVTVSHINNYRFRITDSEGKSFVLSATVNGTSISCGIYQLAGINSIYSSIGGVYRNDENRLDKIHIVLTEFFRQVFRLNAFKFMLVSTNISLNATYIGIYNRLFGDYQHSGNNPNSGNDIALWVVSRDQFI